MAPKAPTNMAAYLMGPKVKPLAVKEAPYTPPGEHEIVVKNHALAINPVDWFKQYVGNMLLSWIKYPAILGGDVAGEVYEVGKGVTRFKVGDRVLAHAVGIDEKRNRASEGAFQQYTVIRDNLASPIPDSMSYEKACVIPLTCSTAAVGLFQKDYLALNYPTVSPQPTGEALIVWAGSSSVGSNGIQLATAAGYEVYTVASPRNFDYVKSLGAVGVFDYRSPTVIQDIISALSGKTVAGGLAIGNNSAESIMAILEKCRGKKFVAMASFPQPDIMPEGSGQTWSIVSLMLGVIKWQIGMTLKSKVKGIPNKFVVGDTLQNNEVSYKVYEDFLPQALAEGKYVAAPEPHIVGHGLEFVQEALDLQKKGVSAKKVVVTL